MKKMRLGMMLVVLVMVVTAISCTKKDAPVQTTAQSVVEKSITLQPGVLAVGMEIGYPPMEYFDTDGRTPIGFDVSMAKEIAKRLNLRVEFVDTAWDGIFAGVDAGKYDAIMSSVTVTPERLVNFNFTRSYIVNAQALVLPKGSKVTARTPEELTGLSVAFQGETTTDFYLKKLVAAGLNYKPFAYDKVLNCFDELRLGRVDAIVCDSLVAYDYVTNPAYDVEIVWQGGDDETFGVCLKKGNDAITAAIDKVLGDMFEDGTLLRLSQEIFNLDMVSAARK
jgi:polar amino acid transport system substrate-binding protein